MLQLKIDLLDLTEEDLRTGNSLIADKLEQVVGNNALGINLPLLQETFTREAATHHWLTGLDCPAPRSQLCLEVTW